LDAAAPEQREAAAQRVEVQARLAVLVGRDGGGAFVPRPRARRRDLAAAVQGRQDRREAVGGGVQRVAALELVLRGAAPARAGVAGGTRLEQRVRCAVI